MLPTDYRLDHVVARLVERLEGQRRTFLDRPPDASLAAFDRTARAHVAAAIAEMRTTGWTDEPEAHAVFLEREIVDTFLPRYHAAATAMNAVERRGFGLGALAEPLGRLGLVAGSLVFAWFVLLKLVALPIVWPLFLLTAAAPFAPDLAAALHRRRYRAELEGIVADMTRIQDNERAYLTSGAAAEAAARTPERPRATEGE